MNNKSLLGIICIAIGGILALNLLGVILGPIIALLLPIFLIVCGVVGLRNGKTFIGSLLLIVGFVFLLGQLGTILKIILVVVLIAIGIAAVKGNWRRRY